MQADIVESIAQYTNLHKVGSKYFGVCPFCDEMPFRVDPLEQAFHCFACARTGSADDFAALVDKLKGG